MTQIKEVSEQVLEFKKSISEGRQPVCTGCGHKMNEVRQTQYTFIKWKWNQKLMKYVKDDSGGDADKPYCCCCECKNWELVDCCKEALKLGLTY